MKIIYLVVCLFIYTTSLSQGVLLDEFESLSDWEKVESEGTSIDLKLEKGLKGNCIKVDFDFKLGSGFCGIRRKINFKLPQNYQFEFYIKGKAKINNLEFKLIDPTGENVWWLNQRNFEFPKNWGKITIKKRDISFAWGPRGGGDIDEVGYIEIIISAVEGGRGSIFIDELSIVELEPDSIRRDITKFSFSSSSGNPSLTFDGKSETFWETNEKESHITIDFGAVKEYGGLVVDWDEKDYAKAYKVLSSKDGKEWSEVYNVKNGVGGRNYIFLKNAESRFIKILMLKPNSKKYKIREIRVKDISFSSSINEFFKYIAKDAPYGYFPKYFWDKQIYWTVIGIPDDAKESLISEDGVIEPEKLSFTVEPFLFVDGKLFNYTNVKISQFLEDDYLPIPSVIWENERFNFEIKAFVTGEKRKSCLMVRYKVKNTGDAPLKGKLFLAIRPFQVLPPWQNLNITGGATKINKLRWDGKSVIVNDHKKIIPIVKPNDIGFAEFNQGDITRYLSKGVLPPNKNANCEFGYASGGIEYNMSIPVGDEKSFCLIIPLYDTYSELIDFEEELEKIKNYWRNLLDRVRIEIPDRKIVNSIKSNLAYILINADDPALQPGSRNYERSWIRDGALISNSLLYFGFYDNVKNYIEWYAKHQYENGKIPCVVDSRGPDPVPEHDSNGEFIYTLFNYFKFTGDTTFLMENFDKVIKAVDYLAHLISQRKTDEFKTQEKLPYYGLLTESISHEGYSSKPMHSYWDNFWALRGLKDAANIAKILGQEKYVDYFNQLKKEFEKNLYNSLSLTVKEKKIDYIPGCVELGDFDPTSTAIAIYPTFAFEDVNNFNAETLLFYLHNTFKKYYEFFKQRKTLNDWKNYTPYEIRLCGAFIHLGEKEIAYELLDFFFEHQRPYNWNMWAEVVWNSKDSPGTIGDMPHSWVGAEFINSIRQIFIYEKDSLAVIGAGIKEEWLSKGKLSVENLETYFGKINLYFEINDKILSVKINSNEPKFFRFCLANPFKLKPAKVLVNGVEINNFTEKFICPDYKTKLPLEIKVIYQ
jgi:hypothetical protein